MSLMETAVQPTLETERLVLRPFTRDDAPAVYEIVSDREIAYNTLTIPHPYPETMAEEWIRTHAGLFERGHGVVYAATLRGEGTVVAAVGISIEPPHRRGELGYWVGRPYWNRGYATEASRALLRYCFAEMGVHRIQAHHFTRNPASGVVMRKLGMTHEGHLRGHTYKWGRFEDLEVYGILRDEIGRLAP